MKQKTYFENHLRNAIPPAVIVLFAMWMVYWADFLFIFDFHKLGVLPKTIEGLKGIIFMPLIHSHSDIKHIINNSVPTFLLLTLLFYSYKEIALKVFFGSWLFTGILVWIFATNKGSFHIGMSGVIYALASFLFTSGLLRKYMPLQALSFFIVFLYGSMIWGIFPTSTRVSWEGHLMGMIVGIIYAIYFKSEGPQRPKYQYEIEKELGIEPPDFEAMYLKESSDIEDVSPKINDVVILDEETATNEIKITYHYKENRKK